MTLLHEAFILLFTLVCLIHAVSSRYAGVSWFSILIRTAVLLSRSCSFPPVHDWLVNLWQTRSDFNSSLIFHQFLDWHGKASLAHRSSALWMVSCLDARADKCPCIFFPRFLSCLNAFSIALLYLRYAGSKVHCKEHWSDACVAAWFSIIIKILIIIKRALEAAPCV